MKKSHGKINIVDVVVLLVLLVVVGYAIYALSVRLESDNGGTAEIQYVVQVDRLRSGLSDKLSEGEAVYNDDGEYMGNISSVAVSTAYYEGADENGGVVYSVMEGYETMYVTVSCNADVKKSGYFINGESISAGDGYVLRSPSLWFEGVCVNVEETEG